MIKFETLIQFIADHGEAYNLTVEDVALVGVDTVLDHASKETTYVLIGDPISALHQYFAEQFLRDYDRAFRYR